MKRTIIASFALALLGCAGAAARNTVSDTTGFRTASSANAVELLTGRISGVRVSSVDGNPAGALNVNIRGINTLRSDNQPLWIVDGIQLSTDLNQNLDAFWQYGEQSYSTQLNPLAFLNAYDIESIEVLKDVSATTLYGAKGANGVIIVKTRVDKSARRTLNWSSNLGVNLTGNKGVSHNHYLGFSGTRNNTSYNISGTFRNVTGNLASSHSTYGTLKANFETKANKVLWFNFNALLSAGNSYSPSAVPYLGRPSMTLAMRDAALSPMTTVDQWAADYDDITDDFRGLMSVGLQINFAPWLNFKLDGGVDYQYNQRILWYGKTTEFGAPSSTNENGGAASNVFSRLMSYNGKASLNLDRYVADDHHVKASAAFEMLGNLNDFNTMNGTNFVIDDLRGKGLLTGSYVIQHRKYDRNYSHYGAIATVGYDYRGLAGVSGTFRWDNTAKYQGNESHFYPAVDGFVDVRGFFFDDAKAVSALKLKAGWGKSGLEKYIPYELTGNYLAGDWYQAPVNTGMYFDGIDRVTTSEGHVTVELGFLADRISLAATWFDRSTQDDYIMYQMASGEDNLWKTGICENVYERVNSIRNRGYEFDLGARIIDGTDWKWSLDANFAVNENRVTDIAATDFHGREVGTGVYATCNALGHSVSSLYGYRTDAQGNFLDITGDGLVDEYDKVILGHSVPKYYGGLQTNLSWRGLSLEVALDGAAGHEIANLHNVISSGKTDTAGCYSICDRDVESGNYLRLRQVGLKYRIPVKAKWLRDLTVRVSGQNLATFTRYSGWNPDVNCFGNGSLSSGLDYGSYPIYKTVMFGVSVKF